jgi:site-specific DNA-methyltransferase (adenine-specific)
MENKDVLHFEAGTIVNGDCRHALRLEPDNSVDLVLTDPPYLVNYRDRSGRTIKNDGHDDAGILRAFFEVERVMKDDAYCVSFYGWGRVAQFMTVWRAAGLRPLAHLVFAKRYASKVGVVEHKHESAYLLAKTGKEPRKPNFPLWDVQKFHYSGNKLHPTEKHPATLEPIIRALSNEGDTVLDPFMGSGSTCAAAAMRGRRFLGIELDEDYFHVAGTRLMDVTELA